MQEIIHADAVTQKNILHTAFFADVQNVLFFAIFLSLSGRIRLPS